MKRRNSGSMGSPRGRSQAGAALMIMMLILVLGTSWTLVNAINEASRNTVAAQKQTGDSLLLAKYALLGYLAQQALTSDVPGQFPCPESLSDANTTSEGKEATSCSTLPAIGRLPWKTLGIDKPLDGSGEALWYVVGSGVRAAPINYATTGSLTVDGTSNAAVAMIIAPGSPLDTASNSSTAPSPCTKRNQTSGRNASPLNASDFVECGNATLTALVSSRNDTWGNDRSVSITSAEMLNAIEGVVADRIQRQVAPALNGVSSSLTGWYQTTSLSEWGAKFFPYASSWSLPASNDLCGNNGVTEGLLPLTTGDVTSGTGCSSRWTTASASKVGGTGSVSGVSCTANTTRMRCSFTYSGSPIVQMTTSASNIAMGFRTRPTSTDLTFTPTSGNTVNSITPAMTASTGAGQITIQVKMVNKTSSGTGRINVPHPSDSYLINTATGSDSELAWFMTNQWHYYTYYAISPAVTANPSGTCTSSNVTNCLTLTNAEAGTGNTNDKRIVLVLSGRALSGKTQPSSSLNAYFEGGNDQTSSSGDRTFERNTISTTFNDRPSVCPFQRQTTGSANILCD